jgi:NifU-like protein involved in Fe-S cluster formation
MYSQQVITHFENPRNVGDISDADASVRVENPACGDIMQLSLKLAADKNNERDAVIEDSRFRIRGCVTSIACGSVLTEMLRGKTIAQATSIQRQDVVDALGGLTNETMHGSYLVMDALSSALSKLSAPRKS